MCVVTFIILFYFLFYVGPQDSATPSQPMLELGSKLDGKAVPEVPEMTPTCTCMFHPEY